MPPNVKEEHIQSEKEDCLEKLIAPQADPDWKQEPYVINVISIVYIHLAAIYGGYLGVTEAKWSSLIFMYMYHIYGFLGITAGCHRLWSHRSYKATRPLQVLLMLCQSAVMQVNAICWAQIHRQHHQYSDTDADPHNATRGFFFSHIGWTLVKRHPEVVKRRQFVDVSDIRNNPVLIFQKKHTIPLVILMSVLVPTLIPLVWGESFKVTWHLNMVRLCASYHCLFIINSVAHKWGNKPYDKNIRAVENKICSFFALGDSFHNYHHVFPWDYKTGEFGNYSLNFTTLVIDLFAKIGWAYDLKTASGDIVSRRAKRTGDGSDLREKLLCNK